MSDQPATVHIIDDDASLLNALDSLFRSTGLSTKLYDSATQFLERLPESGGPACIVVDVRMPGVSGLEFQDRLKQLGFDLPIILMTGHGDIPMSVRSMKAGAVDFLTKPFRDQDMLDAVSEALRRHGERISDAEQLDEIRQRYETLTVRERQVMEGVVAGRMNKQVAGDLGLSEITIKIHRGSLMRKMEARSLADLVRMAILIGLPAGASNTSV